MNISLIKKITLSLFAMILIFTQSSSLSESNPNSKPTACIQDASDSENTDDGLPVIGSLDNLKKIVEGLMSSNKQMNIQYSAEVPLASGSAKKNSTSSSAAATPDADYSTTNIQVNGVDEGDIVKTDGNYIYQISRNRLIITKAYPPENMRVMSITDMADKNFTPSEIYLDDTRLVLIGASVEEPLVYRAPAGPNKGKENIMPPPYRTKYSTKAIIYDISDREKVSEIRQIGIDGSLSASRKIGSKLYLILSKGFGRYNTDTDISETIPSYSDSISSGESKKIGLDSIKYFPDTNSCNYLIIGTVDISAKDEISVKAYLGSGEDIYMSQDSLYIAVTKYERGMADSIINETKIMLILPAVKYNTTIYRFALFSGKVQYSGSANVPGRVLNQFSMDEYNGYFRVATTSASDFKSDSMSNNVYILDTSMNVTGRLENIAPGEKIYSARFMGNRGYLVTFKNTDPLFSLDLSAPYSPKVLGELKIPGYSNYLHPYDENHIIGFGKDTIEIQRNDKNGKAAGSTAYYLGMKISLFDVTDISNPVEMYTQTIGDRGTDSEILSNHKALLFSKEKNLLSFPVTEHLVKNSNERINKYNGYVEYGQYSFQGAYVYNIDLENGFTLKGRITHMPQNKQGQYENNSSFHINRIIYINNTLYTLSDRKITASDMTNLNETGEVTLTK